MLLLGAVGLLLPQHVEEVLAAPLYAGVEEGRPGTLVAWLAFDAFVNALTFAVFAIAIGTMLRRQRWWVAALAAAAGGVVVESIQLLLPERTADLHDVLSDGIGALLGGLVLREGERRRRSAVAAVQDGDGAAVDG